MGAGATPEDVARRAWRGFLVAHDRVLAQLDAALVAECDMTHSEYEVLAHLAEAEDHRLRMNELAALARLSPSGLTRRFDSLARRGWVVRERSALDRRGVLARLTPEGLARAEAARPVHDRGVREHFAEVLGDEGLAALAELLERVAAANDPDAARAADAAQMPR